ncbi:hypothetical protein EDC19_1038 [Natranaerovirga hydrolytica]|uniref:ABC-2 family transporter n=1 Tax=Natranaerovirga hydrolytica TaxID=680378 RepID=A0A4R1MZA9_9FIRM|nr:hypothetical protein [Natranaerovirga hydrolytica]TCK98606.1 hypothetical protein EDC19_1038 [Natranaerovirga hydrolytica]
MKKEIKTSLYLLSGYRNPILIFYMIMISIALLIGITSSATATGQVNTTASGLEISTIIFLFVVGLNAFKEDFKFLMANNVTRKKFYISNILTMLSVTFIMSIIDVTLSYFYQAIVGNYESLGNQIYGNMSVIASILYYFSLYTLAIVIGLVITIIYYRSNQIMKIIVSITPIALFYLMLYLNSQSNNAIGEAVGRFFVFALGLSRSTPNPYMGVITFFLASIGLLLINKIIMIKAPIKN